MLNSLIIAFLYQEIAIIDKAMPAAAYAYANLGQTNKKIEEYRTALISEYPSLFLHQQ
ncbi:hypothetical protein [Nostoc sp.]|uniref:hypothetical protein n=1 Tax=Nostoc sp. TaxID=1180 RepID=UPI002FF9CA8E